MTDAADLHDGREIYCRKLGHELRFAYCRSTDGRAPCSLVFDCWFERFDVQGFLVRHVPEDQLAAIARPAPPKMLSLVELIAEARARTG